MDDLKRWRRDLHQIPELGLKETQTTAYLKAELEKMGYQPQPLLETGLYVFIDHGYGKSVAFRTDIDGLPVNEETGVDFASTHKGIMHACGHDGHMTALLGFAKALKENKEPILYDILLIFQPAEESPGGARIVCEKGLLKQFNVESIFGIHLMPLLDEGVIASKPGGLMAECGELDVKVIGRGAHAGLPHEGVDSLLIACSLINEYQHILTRMKTPFHPAIMNIGEIHGGTARNSVAKETEFHGTVRCYSDEMFAHLIDSIGRINKGFEEAYGCQIEWSCPPFYPAVINDKKLFNYVSSITSLKELDEPLMLAEDFSFYQKEVKGLFIFVGTKTKEFQSGLHTGTFNFNESVLQSVVDMYMKIILNYQEEN